MKVRRAAPTRAWLGIYYGPYFSRRNAQSPYTHAHAVSNFIKPPPPSLVGVAPAAAFNNFDSPKGTYKTVDASDRSAYVQWNMRSSEWSAFTSLGMDLPPQFSTDDSWIEECFGPRGRVDDFLLRTHWRMLLVGQENAGMFNHKDTLRSASFQAQIEGRKRWHLCEGEGERERERERRERERENVRMPSLVPLPNSSFATFPSSSQTPTPPTYTKLAT